MSTIETRIPSAGSWIKSVTEVKETAKIGYDWAGDFLQSGRLSDQEVGTIAIGCSAVGSRKHKQKQAILYVLCSDGNWVEIQSITSNEWAYELRETARAWLAKDAETRDRDARGLVIANLKTELQYASKRLAETPQDTWARQRVPELTSLIAAAESALARGASSAETAAPLGEVAQRLAAFSTEELLAEITRRQAI